MFWAFQVKNKPGKKTEHTDIQVHKVSTVHKTFDFEPPGQPFMLWRDLKAKRGE